MTNPTDIPMNWQDGAQTTPEAPSQEDINAALEILDQNYAEIEAAYNLSLIHISEPTRPY